MKTISELQQDIVDVNDEYLDYSGVITVALKAGIVKDTSDNVEEIEVQSDETLENYIKLEWLISENVLKTSGNIYVQIKASSENFIWKTYPAKFLVVESL